MAPRGMGTKSGGALPKLRILCRKTAFFGPKTAPNPTQNGQTNGNGGYYPLAPSLPHDKVAFLALYHQDMSEKRRKNG